MMTFGDSSRQAMAEIDRLTRYSTVRLKLDDAEYQTWLAHF
jgi:hypothetical protein